MVLVRLQPLAPKCERGVMAAYWSFKPFGDSSTLSVRTKVIKENMKKTKQEEALEKAQAKYGDTAFTEDTLNYKRVGFINSVTKRQVKAIGKTWAAAFKVADKQFKVVSVAQSA